MDVDQQAAATSLNAIEETERRTSQAIFYGIASSFLILWGAITAAGYVAVHAWPRYAGTSWMILTIAGLAVTVAMTRNRRRGLTRAQQGTGWRILYAQLALLGFGTTVVALLGPFSGRQLNAFWPLLFMLGYVLAGIWAGRFFVLAGVTVALLTVAGFYLSGAWFPLWMAAVNGGGLLLGGLWLRRQGAAL